MKNAIGAQTSKYNNRDRDSRNKKNTGASYNNTAADPMQAIPFNQHQVNKTTTSGLQDMSDHSRNLMLNASLEYKSNKDALMKNVKKQNQKLLQQQRDNEFN